jgi:dTMP kinase
VTGAIAAAEAGASARPGCFITFEGGEGAGKSTQIARLAAWLRAGADGLADASQGALNQGSLTWEVVTTREPGGSPRAERIRAAVLAGAAKPYGPFAEALLFAAARLDHLATLIRPALERGAVVLCDRFSDSTRAYQGAAGGVDAGTLAALERVVVGATRPDLTLILDLPPEIGLARARQRDRAAARGPDRFEAEALGFHERLRAAYRAIAEAEPGRCAVIDAQGSPEAVAQAVRAAVAARLPHLIRGKSDAA